MNRPYNRYRLFTLYLVGHEQRHASLEEGEGGLWVSEGGGDVHEGVAVLGPGGHRGLVLVYQQVHDVRVASLRGDVQRALVLLHADRETGGQTRTRTHACTHTHTNTHTRAHAQGRPHELGSLMTDDSCKFPLAFTCRNLFRLR